MSRTEQATRPRRRSRVPESEPTLRAGRPGVGEPLLLLHPFMLSHDVWADVVPLLARDHDVVAATLPGHWGGQHLPRRDVSVEAFADGVEKLLDDLGWETCHVAGNSIGGWLALELARRGRARSVVAIAPAGGWRRFSAAQMAVGVKFALLTPAVAAGHATGDLALRFRPVLDLALATVSARPRQVSRARREGFLRSTSHCSAFLPYLWSDLRRGGIRDLDQITTPLRLVLCAKDRLLPPERYGRMYLDALPDADVVRLPDVGHVPMLDDPALVARVIAAHVSAHAGVIRNDVPA